MLIPFVVRQNAWHEWSNYLWLIEEQAASIRALHHPSLFLHEGFGVFYPQYVFYGGSLWALAGALAIVLGSAWAAYLVVLAGAVAMGYGGGWWLARQLGAGGWESHAVALIALSAPYLLVGNVYGRGDWAEAIALCALPLGIAGGVAILRSERLGPGPLAAVVAAGAVVAGSHSITLLWGGLLALALLAGAAWAVPGELRWSRLGALVGAGALGVALDAWFLIPGLTLSHHTNAYADASALQLQVYDRAGVLFSPIPRAAYAGDVLRAQLPILAIAWGVVTGGVLLRRGAPRALRRAYWCLVVLLVVLVTLILWDGLWPHLPHFMRTIQFAYRLEGYVDLVSAGLVLVGVLAIRATGAGRRWSVALALVVAAQLAFVAYVAVATDPERHVERSQVAAGRVAPSFSEGQQTMFRLRNGRRLDRPGPTLSFSPADVRDETATFDTPGDGAGRLYATNVFYSPLVEVTGDARIAGRDPGGFAVLAVGRGGSPATIRAARPATVRAGTLITLLAALGIAALLIGVAVGGRRRGRR